MSTIAANEATTTPQPMTSAATAPRVFPDRRAGDRDAGSPPGVERRQFAASQTSERPEVNELASAIDQYKLTHRRRFVTVEELLGVIESLGYSR